MKLEDHGNEWAQRRVLEELELEGEQWRYLTILIFPCDVIRNL